MSRKKHRLNNVSLAERVQRRKARRLASVRPPVYDALGSLVIDTGNHVQGYAVNVSDNPEDTIDDLRKFMAGKHPQFKGQIRFIASYDENGVNLSFRFATPELAHQYADENHPGCSRIIFQVHESCKTQWTPILYYVP